VVASPSSASKSQPGERAYEVEGLFHQVVFDPKKGNSAPDITRSHLSREETGEMPRSGRTRGRSMFEVTLQPEGDPLAVGLLAHRRGPEAEVMALEQRRERGLLGKARSR
jgi:hypothetical protein